MTAKKKTNAKAALTRDAILTADDLKTEKIEVPEWGGLTIVLFSENTTTFAPR